MPKFNKFVIFSYNIIKLGFNMIPTEIQEKAAKALFIIFATILMMFPKVHAAELSSVAASQYSKNK